MKEKLIKIFKTKKEIIILAVVMIALISTIILATHLSNKNIPIDIPVVNYDEDNNSNNDENNDEDIKETPKKVVNAPIEGDYVNIRTFYDLNNKDLTSSIISNANSFQTSKGVSFSKSDNSEFECLAMADGVVTNVEKTELSGYVVEVENDCFTTKFYNLSSVNVKENDSVTSSQVIGKSGESLYDTELGNNVFVEMKADGEYINPLQQIGLLVNQVGRTEK